MTNHPVKLRFKIHPKLNSIGTHCVQTNKNISGKYLIITIIKGNYIRIVVMIQVLAVDIQNVIVMTKIKDRAPIFLE